jgi:hypothetical protein
MSFKNFWRSQWALTKLILAEIYLSFSAKTKGNLEKILAKSHPI